MMRRVARPLPSVPVRRGGMPARWCASNLILVMLAALIAVVSIVEFLRG